MTRLVVGLCGNPGDRPVVEYAAKLTAQWDAQVTFVHAIPRTTLWLVSSVQANSDDYVEAMRRSLKAEALSGFRANEIVPTLRVTRGDPARELAAIAHDTNADLILIGGPDHRALQYPISSVERRLEHCSEVPILIVPKGKVTQQ